MLKINEIKHVLKRLYNEKGNERCGFLLEGNEVREVQNVCSNPTDGFLVSTGDIRQYIESNLAIASWHTHPDKDANLSGEDYRCFRSYPNLFHFIIGNNGVKCYKFSKDKGAILEITETTTSQS